VAKWNERWLSKNNWLSRKTGGYWLRREMSGLVGRREAN
jgi:hypothetical protein